MAHLENQAAEAELLKQEFDRGILNLRLAFSIPEGVSPTNVMQRSVVRASWLAKKAIEEVTQLKRG